MAGLLSATVTKVTPAQNVTSAFTGAGYLDAAITPKVQVAAAFTAVGSFTATALRQAGIDPALSASGTLTATATQTYAPAAAFSTAGALAATVVKGTAHYYDDFNRTDSATLGANWITRNISAAEFQISGNKAASPSTDSTNISASVWAQTMPTDSVKVTFTVKGMTGGNVAGVLLRSSSTAQLAVYAQAGSSGISIIRNVSGNSVATLFYYGQVVYTANTGANVVDGDTFSVEAQDNHYILSKNGAVVGTWVDSSNFYPYIDSSHREVGIIGLCQGAAALTAGIDTWEAEEVAPRPFADFSSEGTLSATVSKWFEQSTETNTARTNQTRPANCTGVWVTLIGAGGGGGSGRRGVIGAGSGGGGGGGGGGFVPRTFIPVASLGATYSVVVPTSGGAGAASQTNASTNGNNGTAGAATTFVSGATSISAGGGGFGTGGTTTTSTAGAGGTISGASGDAGASGGGGTSGATGTFGGSNGASASGAAGGGGGGGLAVTTNAKNAGGDGGDANGQTGGGGGNNAASPNGAGGGTLTAGIAAAGGGGGGGGTSASGRGGNCNGYGGGGGGSAGYTANTGVGGNGGPGYSKLEWV